MCVSAGVSNQQTMACPPALLRCLSSKIPRPLRKVCIPRVLVPVSAVQWADRRFTIRGHHPLLFVPTPRPWAIQQAGFALGCGTIFAMMLLTLYTCSIILHRGQNGYLNGEAVEFSDVVRHYLGEGAYRLASCFSIMTLWGAGMVLWVLMTSFLGNILTYFEESHGPHASGDQFSTSLWNPHVVPLYLIVLLFPLMCVKDISFFTKFNSLGVLSIIYMLFFVVFTTAYGGKQRQHLPGGEGGAVEHKILSTAPSVWIAWFVQRLLLWYSPFGAARDPVVLQLRPYFVVVFPGAGGCRSLPS